MGDCQCIIVFRKKIDFQYCKEQAKTRDNFTSHYIYASWRKGPTLLKYCTVSVAEDSWVKIAATILINEICS